VSHPRDVLDYLNSRRRRDERIDWRAAIGAQALILRRRESSTLRGLWKLTHGPASLRKQADDEARLGHEVMLDYRFRHSMPAIDSMVSFTHPAKIRDGWQITIIPSTLKSVRRDYYRLLVLEAIRQQLTARRGFHCPLLLARRGATCVCRVAQPKTWRLMYGLSLCGASGLLDEGKWTSLPRPCAE
jgi:hypothetical protein